MKDAFRFKKKRRRRDASYAENLFLAKMTLCSVRVWPKSVLNVFLGGLFGRAINIENYRASSNDAASEKEKQIMLQLPVCV